MHKQRLPQSSSSPFNTHQQNYRSEHPKTQGRSSLPPRSKLIRRQKIMNCNTAQDQQIRNSKEYVTHTPKYTKTQKVQNRNLQESEGKVRAFKIDESFENKCGTVKRDYENKSDNRNNEITLNKNQISLKPRKLQTKTVQSHTFQDQNLPKDEVKEQPKPSGNGILTLREGWAYKGQYIQGVFHGFGQLYHQDKLVYSGSFQMGYFHGYGKIKKHHAFDYLVKGADQEWTAYFGEFTKGNITGFGQLWLRSGDKIVSKWKNGCQIGKKWVSTQRTSGLI